MESYGQVHKSWRTGSCLPFGNYKCYYLYLVKCLFLFLFVCSVVALVLSLFCPEGYPVWLTQQTTLAIREILLLCQIFRGCYLYNLNPFEVIRLVASLQLAVLYPQSHPDVCSQVSHRAVNRCTMNQSNSRSLGQSQIPANCIVVVSSLKIQSIFPLEGYPVSTYQTLKEHLQTLKNQLSYPLEVYLVSASQTLKKPCLISRTWPSVFRIWNVYQPISQSSLS